MGTLRNRLQQIADGERDPSTVGRRKWQMINDYVKNLEEQALQRDEDRPAIEEAPVTYDFDGVKEEMENTEEIVEAVMRNKPETRDNFQKLEHFIKREIQNLDLNVLDDYSKALKASTIQRARRKVFEENPDLRPSEEVDSGRMEREKEFRKEMA